MLENINPKILATYSAREKARLLYESTPMTFEQVSLDTGVSSRTVKRWAAADGGWAKIFGTTINQRAHLVADNMQQEEFFAAERTEAAVDERAAILLKHRTEWTVVRGLAIEAARDQDFNKARLAVEVGKAIDLAQKGECRAWGLDVTGEANSTAVTVVIERGY